MNDFTQINKINAIKMKRIGFIKVSVFLLALTCVLGCYGKTGKKPLSKRVGVCTSASNVPYIKEAGGNHVEESLSSLLVPEKDEDVFLANLQTAISAGLPVSSTNGFFPGDLHVVGPDADHERALRYTEVAMRRAKKVGIKVTVLGSGASRKIPDGFPYKEAEEQFVKLLQKMGPIAKKYGVIIAIEPLRKQETNFINTVQEGYELAKKVNHPNIAVNADIYHMMQEGEGPQSILNAGRKYIRNVHVAENAQRTAPGVEGDDFTPYFKALKKIKYRGTISIECRWDNFQKQVGPAIKEVQRQLQSIGF